MGGHSRFLVKEFGLDEETVKLIRSGQRVPDLSDRDQALIRFVRKAARDPRSMAESDIRALKAEGFDPAEIVEALSTALLSAFTNTLALTLKFEDDLEPFGMRSEYF